MSDVTAGLPAPLPAKASNGRWRKYGFYYLMLAPAIVCFIIFNYIPMYGVIIAFKNYRFIDGIIGSPWIGMENFNQLFNDIFFWRILRNTLIISGLHILFGFPAPIVLALLFNEIINGRFKKIIQTISYLPHFMSWVILSGIMIELLSPSRGAINFIITLFGGKPIHFLADPDTFVGVLVASHLWQSVGWGSIIYLAAIAGINQDQYESATIDGANRFQQMRYITLPSLIPVMTVLFILNVGGVMNAGFDQIFNLYNPAVYSVADIIDTYVYRIGLIDTKYGFSTAVGLFKNVVALVLVIGTNYIVKRFNEYGIW
ncbi:ABC transporter permease [Paenibacillus contaminans]|uniref:Sugar ABC transporter permease n=1 Tax=Paenibacillus contaminans TaxID=450362 RepID=A0A329LWI8_9BACL|nr:ABC transporter permease subunit [Paenibacillus contaminans]RAV12189.1 sugar ABC transporter permease [Paenibacillus contaminans]